MGTLEPLALSPRAADAYLSISKSSLPQLIPVKNEARKDGPRTLVDLASLTATTGAQADTISPVLR
jgi:hypothetical protein